MDIHITPDADGDFLVTSAPVVLMSASETERNDCKEKTENLRDPHCAISKAGRVQFCFECGRPVGRYRL